MSEMPMPPEYDEARRAAYKRVKARRDLGGHVVAYLIVNAFLVVVWWVNSPHGYFWPVWVLAGWGIGLLFNIWDVFGRRPITEQDVDRLHRLMTRYDHPPQSPDEEREQRFAELAFHETLAELCPNPVLSFACQFLIRLLKELTICHRIYERPQPELRAGGHSYQLQLLEALRKGDAKTTRNVMGKHMRFAQDLMEAQEAEVLRQFLR